MKTVQKSATSKEHSNPRLDPYDTLVKAQMTSFYDHLSEKDKRLYAAAEAIKLPYGGIIYIASLFGCDRKTISRGIVELKNPELIEKDTSEFACDSIRQWWYNQGRYDYPKATSILILCDAGGSNSYRLSLWMRLVWKSGLHIIPLTRQNGIQLNIECFAM